MLRHTRTRARRGITNGLHERHLRFLAHGIGRADCVRDHRPCTRAAPDRSGRRGCVQDVGGAVQRRAVGSPLPDLGVGAAEADQRQEIRGVPGQVGESHVQVPGTSKKAPATLVTARLRVSGFTLPITAHMFYEDGMWRWSMTKENLKGCKK